jgi:hypothetical protein
MASIPLWQKFSQAPPIELTALEFIATNHLWEASGISEFMRRVAWKQVCFWLKFALAVWDRSDYRLRKGKGFHSLKFGSVAISLSELA